MQNKQQSKNTVQMVWGAALLVVGVAVFFRIPQVIPKLAQMGQSTTTITFIRICFYLMGFILIGGGISKIVRCVRRHDADTGNHHPVRDENDLDR